MQISLFHWLHGSYREVKVDKEVKDTNDLSSSAPEIVTNNLNISQEIESKLESKAEKVESKGRIKSRSRIKTKELR